MTNDLVLRLWSKIKATLPPPAALHINVRSLSRVLDHESPLAEAGLHPQFSARLIELAKPFGRRCLFRIHLHSEDADEGQAVILQQAIREHFQRAADMHQGRVRENFQFARHATLIGLPIVAVLLGIAAKLPEGGNLLTALRESLTIFAWVTMWRPAELWLFAHTPDRRLRDLAQRLAAAKLVIEQPPRTTAPSGRKGTHA